MMDRRALIAGLALLAAVAD
jgi:hypothetical protein